MGTAGFGGSFAPIVHYEKWEIHPVFPHFPYFRLDQNTGRISLSHYAVFMEIFKSTDDYETAYNKKISYLAPEYIQQFAALASLGALRARTNANGFIGSLEYGALTDFGEEWQNSCILVDAIDIKALRDFQMLEYPLQKKDGRFKPSPPGMNPDGIIQLKRQNKLKL